VSWQRAKSRQWVVGELSEDWGPSQERMVPQPRQVFSEKAVSLSLLLHHIFDRGVTCQPKRSVGPKEDRPVDCDPVRVLLLFGESALGASSGGDFTQLFEGQVK